MKRSDSVWETQLMKQALQPFAEKLLRQIDVYNRIPHKYSAKTLARIERVLWQGGVTRLKTRIILIAMIVIVLVCAACVAPSLVERYSEGMIPYLMMDVVFKEFDAALEGDYPPGMPSYLPQGYRMVKEEIVYHSAAKQKNNGEQKYAVYYNGQNFIYLRRHGDTEEMMFSMDNTAFELETISGEKQNYVLQRFTDDSGEWSIGWKTGDYCYTIRGYLPGEELLKMAESLKEEPSSLRAPSYVPDGFRESACHYNEWWQCFTYTGVEERKIIYTRRDWEAEWGTYPFDDTVSPIEEYDSDRITVNGTDGTWIHSRDGLYHHICWQEDDWWYEIGGETELDVLIRMAESITLTSFRKASDYAE